MGRERQRLFRSSGDGLGRRKRRDRDDVVGHGSGIGDGVVEELQCPFAEAAFVMEHALAAHDDDAGDFQRRQPAQVDVRRHATRELHGADGHVGDAVLQIGEGVDVHLLDRCRHQVAQDREVVGRRVPPHVGIAADAAHAEALEREMVDAAQPAGIDPALGLLEQRIVEKGLVHEQRGPPLLRRLHQLSRLGGAQRQRFFDPTVFAGGDDFPRQRIVRRRWGGHQHGIDILALQQIGRVGEELDFAIDGSAPLRIGIADCLHLHAVQVAEDAQQFFAPVAGADDADA